VRECTPGFADSTSLVLTANWARSIAPTLRALSACPRRGKGGPKSKSEIKSKRSCRAFAALLIFSPFAAPSIAAGGGGKARLSERRDARVRGRPGSGEKHRALAHRASAVAGWTSLWLLSLGHTRESDPLAVSERKLCTYAQCARRQASGSPALNKKDQNGFALRRNALQ
jgi:hypothetical protein